MRANDGMIIREAGKMNPRADSFSLYMNFVGKTMMDNLLPKSRNDNKLHIMKRPVKGVVVVKKNHDHEFKTPVKSSFNKEGATPIKTIMPSKIGVTSNGGTTTASTNQSAASDQAQKTTPKI